MPIDAGTITSDLTELDGFLDWMCGMARHSAGWRLRDDGSALFIAPYFVTKNKKWKPMKGIVRGKQDALREEWNAKDEGE